MRVCISVPLNNLLLTFWACLFKAKLVSDRKQNFLFGSVKSILQYTFVLGVFCIVCQLDIIHS